MVIKEHHEGVRILRLANPPSNVLSLTLLAALKGEVVQAREDPEVRCLLLASSYPRYFSTGLDLEELTSLPPERQTEPFGALLELFRLLSDLPKPTVAALSGSAFLGGWILAMACDWRLLSAETGRISLSEIRFGLSPTAALIARLREISASPVLVKEMVLRGRTLRAEEALAGGFVDRLVPEASLQEEALREAKLLSRQAPAAYAAVKKALSRRSPGDEAALWNESREDFRRLFETAEAREGIAAMRDKRRPDYRQIKRTQGAAEPADPR